MPFPDFNPVALSIPLPWFTLAIRWYALAYVAGILIGWRYAVGLVRNSRIWGGASPPATDPVIDDLILFSVRRGIPILRLADVAAPAVPIGLFFGRIANFVNGELWGRPTDLPWGIIFPNAGPAPRHPSQLYEAALEGLVLFLILRLATHRLRWLRRPGAVTGLFLAIYGLFRFGLEHVREPDFGMPEFPFGLSMGMILSLPMVLIGLGLILFALLSEPADDPDPGAAIEPGEMQERLSAYPHSVLPNDWVDRVRRGDGARRSGVAEG